MRCATAPRVIQVTTETPGPGPTWSKKQLLKLYPKAAQSRVCNFAANVRALRAREESPFGPDRTLSGQEGPSGLEGPDSGGDSCIMGRSQLRQHQRRGLFNLGAR